MLDKHTYQGSVAATASRPVAGTHCGLLVTPEIEVEEKLLLAVNVMLCRERGALHAFELAQQRQQLSHAIQSHEGLVCKA